MAKGGRGRRRRFASRQCRPTPYPLPSYNDEALDGMHPNRCFKLFDKKDWKDATCSVCMEYPHNAVLLLCSSHEKGCRPYMCGTSFRYSNCLDQYKKAYTKATSSPNSQSLNGSVVDPLLTALACPLCRGQVKGWTVVEPAREYLNAKKRSCMQDKCSFIGTFKELRKHMKLEHPCARPREVDPHTEQKWRRLERERDRDDVMSTIRSSMPGAMFLGDYVIEGNQYGMDDDDTDEEEDGFDADTATAERNGGGFEVGIDSTDIVNVLVLWNRAFASSGNVGPNRGTSHTFFDSSEDSDSNDNGDDGNDISLAGRFGGHGGGVMLGGSGRRRRRGGDET